MILKLNTKGLFEDQPPYWKNFIYEVQANYPDPILPYYYTTEEKVIHELQKWGCNWKSSSKTLIFDDDQSALLFLLRYST